MTPTTRTRCPLCGANLMKVGDRRLCLDCAYQEEIPAPVADTVETSENSPSAPAGSTDAVWLAPRRKRGGVTTPLGFQAGHPCPRVCGGVLTEAGGTLACTVCAFRYPEGDGSSETSVNVELQTPVLGSPLISAGAPPPGPADSAQAVLVEELRREVRRLREENLLLARMVTDFLQQIPKPPDDPTPPEEDAGTADQDQTPPHAEVSAIETEAAEELSSSESPAVRILPRQEAGSRPWWRRDRSGTA